ncbi:hypothetical protein Tco_0694787 [Tanacetum coccineum]
MSFSKRQGNDTICYTKPLDSLKSWNDHFFWVDEFACPASFPWNTSKTVSNDPFPKPSQYNAEHYATLEEKNDFAGGGQSVGIQIVSEVAEIVAEDVVPLQPKHKKKRKNIVDVGEPSHPAKKLRDDHGTPGGLTVKGEVIPTFPFVTSSMSATPKREEGDHTDSLAKANLRTIGAPQRFVISSNFSHHSGANIAEAEVDSFARTSVPLMTMTTTVTSTADPATTAKEKLVESSVFGDGSSSGADHTVGGFSSLTGSDFIVGGIRTVVSPDTDLQKEKGVLDVRVADLAATMKVREQEAADSDAMVTTVKLQNDRLADQLDADFIETCLHLEERFYPHLLTTIAGSRVSFCPKATKKDMQDGLAAGITHGQEGRVLTDVVAFNPSAEDDFTSALQGVQNVNFSLLAELESNKDASVETIMDLLRLDEALVERLGLNESQPHVDQLMGHVHHSPDQTVIGARALSLSLDVSHDRPLSITALEGTGGTSSVAPDTTTALSVTLVSASTILPISMDDYEVMHADGQEGADVEVNPFPNVDDVELDISQ